MFTSNQLLTPFTMALLQSIGKNKDFESGQINAEELTDSLLSNNKEKLKSLLQCNEITFYIPTYDTTYNQRRASNTFFSPYQGRIHYLTQGIACKNIMNISSVTGFIAVPIPFESIDFHELYEKGSIRLFARNPIPPNCIDRATYLTKN